MKLYEDRLRLQRFEEVAPLISDDATFWFSDCTHRGLKEIAVAFEQTWRTLRNEIYRLEDIDWIAVEDTAAICIYRFRWRAEIDDKACEGEGRGTSVLRRDGSEWKIVHEHLSRFPK